jgi:hypothetical protein
MGQNKKTARHLEMAGSWLFDCSLGFHGSRNHLLEDDLERHRVTAALMGKEELAVALKLAFVVVNLMTVIVSMESKVEPVEMKTLGLFGVALGLLSLADHAIIHGSVSFQRRK